MIEMITIDTITTFEEPSRTTFETLEASFPKNDILTDSQEHQLQSIKETVSLKEKETVETPEVRFFLSVLITISILINYIVSPSHFLVIIFIIF